MGGPPLDPPLDPTAAPYLSIVLTGRNDGYGSDFVGRFVRTVAFNHAQLTSRQVPHEFIVVEWAPPVDRPLLTDLLFERQPGVDPAAVRTITTDAQYQDAFSLNPRLAYLEYVAKNVGIRRAAGAYVLASNCDIYLGRTVLDAIGVRALEPAVIYRAARYDLKLGLDEAHCGFDALEDETNLATPPKAIRPPLYGPGTGDFVLADRDTWLTLRGFNEVYRAARVGLDRNFIVKARSSGVPIRDIGGPVYHVNHPGSNRLIAQSGAAPAAMQPPAASPAPRDAVYLNPDGWGLADAPERDVAPRRTHLSFTWDVVPPLVDLRRLSIPAARGDGSASDSEGEAP